MTGDSSRRRRGDPYASGAVGALWLLTLSPTLLWSSNRAAQGAALVALVLGLLGAALKNTSPRVAGLVGVAGFGGASIVTWGLSPETIQNLGGEPLRYPLAVVACGLYALSWGAGRVADHPNTPLVSPRPTQSADRRRNLHVPAIMLTIPISAWLVSRVEERPRVYLAQAVALAGAALVVSSAAALTLPPRAIRRNVRWRSWPLLLAFAALVTSHLLWHFLE